MLYGHLVPKTSGGDDSTNTSTISNSTNEDDESQGITRRSHHIKNKNMSPKAAVIQAARKELV